MWDRCRQQLCGSDRAGVCLSCVAMTPGVWWQLYRPGPRHRHVTSMASRAFMPPYGTNALLLDTESSPLYDPRPPQPPTPYTPNHLNP